MIGYLRELGITTATAFRATTAPEGGIGGIPHRAWDLEGLRKRYEAFTGYAQELREAALAGTMAPEDALIARTRLMDEWRAFPALDPELPAELLPEAWPRAAARELFITTYDLLGPLAVRRVRHVIARYSPGLAPRVSYHSSELKTGPAGLSPALCEVRAQPVPDLGRVQAPAPGVVICLVFAYAADGEVAR